MIGPFFCSLLSLDFFFYLSLFLPMIIAVVRGAFQIDKKRFHSQFTFVNGFFSFHFFCLRVVNCVSIPLFDLWIFFGFDFYSSSFVCIWFRFTCLIIRFITSAVESLFISHKPNISNQAIGNEWDVQFLSIEPETVSDKEKEREYIEKKTQFMSELKVNTNLK